MDAPDVALLLLRLWVAVVMIAHGVRHARTLEGTAGWFASLGFRHAPLQARISAAGEIAIGLGIGAGLLTTPAAAGLVATMAVAFWTIHRHAGFFVFARPDEGYEYVGTLVVVAVALGLLGPGEISVDEALDIAVTGWGGGLIVLAGIPAAAIQLLLFWSRPDGAGDA
ncbi:MAG: DoxX family protein [Nitriliruptorales bacterium]|nr:DoxX family protein [Nitriliruptorales bacterium]